MGRHSVILRAEGRLHAIATSFAGSIETTERLFARIREFIARRCSRLPSDLGQSHYFSFFSLQLPVDTHAITLLKPLSAGSNVSFLPENVLSQEISYYLF